jgi:hypothetical protein
MPWFILFSFFVLSNSFVAFGHDHSYGHSEAELLILESYREQCLQIDEYVVKRAYPVKCHYNYHHFNASEKYYPQDTENDLADKLSINNDKKNIRIATFNVLHPGMAKTQFKDYAVVAKIMNQYDLVAATELIPSVSSDLAHNQSMLTFINRSADLINILDDRINNTTRPSDRQTLIERRDQLITDSLIAPTLYREPGYIKILNELRKVDPSWSLILSPRGEATEPNHVQELVGYYYRSNKIRPTLNQYCKSQVMPNRGSPYACLPHFNDFFFGQNAAHLFSRRPFFASFEAKKFKFSLLASHVIFTSPTDETRMNNIMQAAFNVNSPDELGTGINRANYARFAEVKLTLDFMEKYQREYKDDKVMYLGDLNLEPSNRFWSYIFNLHPHLTLTHDNPSSTTTLRFNSDGSETFGLSSSYDHMMFDEKDFTNCLNSKNEPNTHFFNFLAPENTHLINDYLIRDLPSNRVERILSKAMNLLSDVINSLLTIRYNAVVPDNRNHDDLLENYKRRVFDSQLIDEEYYRVYREVISDHIPISIDCRI